MGGSREIKNTRENIGNVGNLTEIRLVEIWVRKCFGCEMTIKGQNRVILLEIKKILLQAIQKNMIQKVGSDSEFTLVGFMVYRIPVDLKKLSAFKSSF